MTARTEPPVSCRRGFGGHPTHPCGCGSRAFEVEFEETAAFAWLKARAGEFRYHLSYPVGNGFGFQYEPWHWCFRDREVAG